MREYRDDLRAHAVKLGRNPDDIKGLFLVYPTLEETSEEAREKHRRMVAAPAFVEASLASSGTTSDIDFSQFDLDQPLPSRLTTNGEQGSLDKFQQWGSGKTLRQLASERFDSELDLIGAPDEVADKMAQAMEESAATVSLSAHRSSGPAAASSTRSAKGWCRHCSAVAWCAEPIRARHCVKLCANSERTQYEGGS